jgi:uncharacterized membrane protein
MAKFGGSVMINAPVEVVFEYVYNHENTTKFMEGLKTWEPIGELKGLGTLFRLEIQAGPTTFGCEAEITELVWDKLIRWESRSGISNSGAWLVESDGTSTTAHFEQEFVLPGGIAGELLAKTMEPLINNQTRRSLNALKQQVEMLVAEGGQ